MRTNKITENIFGCSRQGGEPHRSNSFGLKVLRLHHNMSPFHKHIELWEKPGLDERATGYSRLELVAVITSELIVYEGAAYEVDKTA